MIGRQLSLFKKSRRGRPVKRNKGVSHLRRPPLAGRFPVHVTVKVRDDVRSLRTRICFSALKSAFTAGRERFGFRLVGYSVQGNHIHLLVEGADARALSRGMQGLTIRMARALNRALERSGKVFCDRYHAHILRTPSEVANARNYLMNNQSKHHEHARGWQLPSSYVDEYAGISIEITAAPQTWLLKVGWRRSRNTVRPIGPRDSARAPRQQWRAADRVGSDEIVSSRPSHTTGRTGRVSGGSDG